MMLAQNLKLRLARASVKWKPPSSKHKSLNSPLCARFVLLLEPIEWLLLDGSAPLPLATTLAGFSCDNCVFLKK